jgi:hypothetical protein
VLVQEDYSRGVDPREVRAGKRDHGVEVSLGPLVDLRLALPCLLGAERIRLHDDDVPAGELERTRVDAREAELEHAARPVSQQLEDLRRGRGGESGRKAAHRYARYMNPKHTGKFLGVPYDWRRPTWARYQSRWWNPKDRRIVMPRAFGWGWDFNLAEIARRLGLRR